MFYDFLMYLWHYLLEVIPALAVGFFLSGLAHEFIPQSWIDRNLGQKGIKPIFMATIIGAILPICCWGTLPIAIGFYKKGARLGPVLSFLVATPATSISALLVTYALLGLKFAIFIFFAVIMMGLLIGIIGNNLSYTRRPQGPPEACLHCHDETGTCAHRTDRWCRIKSALKFAYVDMPKEIGKETLIGILLAAAVAAYVPFHTLIQKYLFGIWGYIAMLIFGLLTYICSTATVPLADALIKQGLSSGAAMVLMIAGPVSSYGTMLVLRKEFGGKILFIYLSLVSIISLLCGFLYSRF